MPNKLFGEVWRARANCYKCGELSYLRYVIKENRRIGLPTCSTCGNSLAFTSSETDEFQMLIWNQLTQTITFYTSTDPVVEIQLSN